MPLGCSKAIVLRQCFTSIFFVEWERQTIFGASIDAGAMKLEHEPIHIIDAIEKCSSMSPDNCLSHAQRLFASHRETESALDTLQAIGRIKLLKPQP